MNLIWPQFANTCFLYFLDFAFEAIYFYYISQNAHSHHWNLEKYVVIDNLGNTSISLKSQASSLKDFLGLIYQKLVLSLTRFKKREFFFSSDVKFNDLFWNIYIYTNMLMDEMI